MQNSSTLSKSLAFLRKVLRMRLVYHFSDTKNKQPFEFPNLKIENDGSPFAEFAIRKQLGFEEFIILLLGLAPHVQPQLLSDILNNALEKPGDYPELGGAKDSRGRGYIPTGETAMFILAGEDLQARFAIQHLFTADHWLCRENIISLEKVPASDPFLNGRIVLDREYIELFTQGTASVPALSNEFPAMEISTNLEWNDLVLNSKILSQVEEVKNWVKYNDQLMTEWGMAKKIKPGFRVLFHGPSGTGKTLTASLLGKYTDKPVFKVDLSMVVSKYIGQTEKNLNYLFNKAQNKNWILFFDEADSLFGKRTSVKDAHDRYANQEVAYLLQRVENYPGLVILSSNLKTNIDEAFTRRFNAIIHFPKPNAKERLKIWENAFPEKIKMSKEVDLSKLAQKYELTGANIMNVVHHACLKTLSVQKKSIGMSSIQDGIQKEFAKEGKVG